MQDITPELVRDLQAVRDKRSTRSLFDTAYLIALEAVSFKDDKLEITEKGLCLLDWMENDQ